MPWPSALFELFEAATRTDFEGLARNKAGATTASDIAGHGRGRPVRHPQSRPELLGQVKWRELIGVVSSCGARQPAVSHSVPTSGSTTAPTLTSTSDVLITPGPGRRKRSTVPT